MTTEKKAPPLKKESIKLAYPHRHGGKERPAGTTIEVWPDQAERIRQTEAERKAAESTEEK